MVECEGLEVKGAYGLRRRTKAGTRGKDVAVVLRKAFVDPDQVVLHGCVVVGCGLADGAAVFAAPGMDVLVGQQGAQEVRGHRFRGVGSPNDVVG